MLNNKETNKLSINIDTNFKLDLGREESLEIFEDETVRDLINPIENYETARYCHNPYSGISVNNSDLVTDIWYQFYFLNNFNPQTHENGLDYSLVGIDHTENKTMLRQSTKSFFKLDFYKTVDGELPIHSNRKLVFSRNLSLTSGETFLFTPINTSIFVPVFNGSKFKDRENMYLFWFQDESALTETFLTGNTFYMTARFFNADDGSIRNFGNKSKLQGEQVDEVNDLYFVLEIDRNNYTYEISHLNGSRVGQNGNEIKFYEILGG